MYKYSILDMPKWPTLIIIIFVPISTYIPHVSQYSKGSPHSTITHHVHTPQCYCVHFSCTSTIHVYVGVEMDQVRKEDSTWPKAILASCVRRESEIEGGNYVEWI